MLTRYNVPKIMFILGFTKYSQAFPRRLVLSKETSELTCEGWLESCDAIRIGQCSLDC